MNNMDLIAGLEALAFICFITFGCFVVAKIIDRIVDTGIDEPEEEDNTPYMKEENFFKAMDEINRQGEGIKELRKNILERASRSGGAPIAGIVHKSEERRKSYSSCTSIDSDPILKSCSSDGFIWNDYVNDSFTSDPSSSTYEGNGHGGEFGGGGASGSWTDDSSSSFDSSSYSDSGSSDSSSCSSD